MVFFSKIYYKNFYYVFFNSFVLFFSQLVSEFIMFFLIHFFNFFLYLFLTRLFLDLLCFFLVYQKKERLIFLVLFVKMKKIRKSNLYKEKNYYEKRISKKFFIKT